VCTCVYWDAVSAFGKSRQLIVGLVACLVPGARYGSLVGRWSDWSGPHEIFSSSSHRADWRALCVPRDLLEPRWPTTPSRPRCALLSDAFGFDVLHPQPDGWDVGGSHVMVLSFGTRMTRYGLPLSSLANPACTVR